MLVMLTHELRDPPTFHRSAAREAPTWSMRSHLIYTWFTPGLQLVYTWFTPDLHLLPDLSERNDQVVLRP
jgi:hypothetical protein